MLHSFNLWCLDKQNSPESILHYQKSDTFNSTIYFSTDFKLYCPPPSPQPHTQQIAMCIHTFLGCKNPRLYFIMTHHQKVLFQAVRPQLPDSQFSDPGPWTGNSPGEWRQPGQTRQDPHRNGWVYLWPRASPDLLLIRTETFHSHVNNINIFFWQEKPKACEIESCVRADDFLPKR